jgi:hypothetical protein
MKIMPNHDNPGLTRRNFCGGLLSLPIAARIDGPRMGTEERSGESQAARRRQIYALHQEHLGPLFDENGRWIGKSTPPIGRERLWNCLSLLSSPSTRDKANAILTRTFAERSTFPLFEIFEWSASTQLLVKNSNDLNQDNKERLQSLVREALQLKREIRFMGYNDNFPAMANVIATLGGELLDDQEAQRRGIEGMHRLLHLLARRDFLSEYTSSTYCPVTMLCYADIAQYSRNEEARAMALEIERIVWMDIAAHFHPLTNILAGPHSRAYAVDSVGHMHQVQMVLYIAFGDRVWMNPRRFVFPPVPGQVVHHDGDVPFMQASTVFISSGTYHPTTAIEHLLFDKAMPYSVSGTSEFGCAAESIWIRDGNGGKPKKVDEVFEYPAGDLVSTTYMTKDYAVGSATAPFLDGNQTDTFFVNFRRAETPNTLEDVSTVFARYTVDDFGPGKPWTDPRNPGVEVTTSMLGEAGRVRTVQKKNTVVVAYRSKSQFVGEYRGLRLTIIVPTIYRPIRWVLFDGKVVQLPFRSTVPGVVAFEDNYFYCAFQPLVITDLGRSEAVRIEEAKGFLSIHFVNYEGSGRSFTRQQLLEISNGFVAEVGGREDYGSFENFGRAYRDREITDEVISAQRVISYKRSGVALGLSYSLASDGLKYASVEDRQIQGRFRRTLPG